MSGKGFLMRKKGQAALEFLMTYGWAIFVVMGAIAALAYFGVFNLDQFLVEKCTFSSGIVCVDHLETTGGVSIVLQNAMGIDIENVSVVIPGCSGDPIIAGQVDSGSQYQFNDVCTLRSSDAFKSLVILNYTNPESLLTHSKRGEVIGRVQ